MSASNTLTRFAHFIGLNRHSPHQHQTVQQDVDWIPYHHRPSSFTQRVSMLNPQTTFLALDTSIGGGIGQSPSPIIQQFSKQHNLLTKPHPTHSPTITVGDATSVRTSLLGFGHQNVGTNSQTQFHNPRKAPSVPASPPPQHPYARGHARLPSVPPPSPPRATVRQRAKTAESSDRSPVQSTFGVLPPPPPLVHPYAISQAIDYHQLETPGAGPSSHPQDISPTTTKPSNHGHTYKPPVPPKSAQTLRTVQGLKQQMIKYSTSTPNLLITSHVGNGAPAVVVQRVKGAEVGANTSPTSGQLSAQTICDAFMFPRPRFVAHVISPPQSPPEVSERNLVASPVAMEDPVKLIEIYSPVRPTATLSPGTGAGLGMLSPPPTPLDLGQVVKEGVQRAKEREEWAQLASGSKLLGGSVTVPFSVGRGRSRTLSGLKSAGGGGHKRNESGNTNAGSERRGSDGKVGLGSMLGKGKTLKVKRSLDYLMMQQQQQQGGSGIRGGQPVEKQATGGGGVKHTSVGSSSVSRSHTHSNSHSRKSSGGGGSSSTRSRINRIMSGVGVGGGGGHGHGHSRNNSASHPSTFTTTGQSVVRKVQSFCVSGGGMSPSEDRFGKRLEPTSAPPTTMREGGGEGDSFVGGYEDDDWVGVGAGGTIRLTPQSRYEEEMLEALDSSPNTMKNVRIAGPVVDIGYKGKRRGSDGTRSNASPGGWTSSRSPSPHHLPHHYNRQSNSPTPHQQTSHVKMQLEVVQESPASKARSLRSSFHDDSLPIPQEQGIAGQFHLAPPPPGRAIVTPSPVPSETYTGVGIALGTPDEMLHPYALPTREDGDSIIERSGREEEDRKEEELHLAGPHLSSPTKAKAALGMVISGNGAAGDFASRHRLPPSVTVEHHFQQQQQQQQLQKPAVVVDLEEDDQPLHPFATTNSPASVPRQARHPFSSASPPITPKYPRQTSRAAKKASVNSVEAMFGGELLAASESVSPLGVREAGEEWNRLKFKLGAWTDDVGEEDEEDLEEFQPVVMIGPGMVNYDYRHSGDSGLGSSTDAHIAKQQAQQNAAAAAMVVSGAEKEEKKVPPRTVSSGGSLLVESPPPSMFPVKTLPGSSTRGSGFERVFDEDREDDLNSSPSDYSASIDGDDRNDATNRVPDSPKSDYGNRSSLFLSMRQDDRDDDESKRGGRLDDTATFGGNRPDSMFSGADTDFLSVIQAPPPPPPALPAPTHPLPPIPTTPTPPSTSPQPSNSGREHSLHGGEASMVSSSSSGSLSGFVPKPIGGISAAGSSSDDLDSFKDLFFVPRRMATGLPPTLSRQSSSASPNLRRSISAGGWSEHGGTQSDDSFYRQSPSHTFTFPRSESPGVEISTSAGDAWQMPKGRLRSPLSSFHSLDPARASSFIDASSPLSQTPPRLYSADPYDASSMYGATSHRISQSVYLIPEEDEDQSVRSSVERFSDENYNLRTIDPQQPTTQLAAHRHSHQFSLVEDHEGDFTITSFTPQIEFSPTIPKPAFLLEDAHIRPPLNLTDPMMRTSFLTTTSGGSNRMSTLISDFPTPPLQGGDVAASIMNYYGVSPLVERPDPLSFNDDHRQFHPDSSRPRLQRQDTFGSHR